MKQLLAIVIGFAIGFATMPAQAQANIAVTAIASGAITAAQVNSADQVNDNRRGVHVIINVTVATAGDYTPKIQGKDPVSGTYYDVLVGTAISTTGITILKVYPGILGVANASANDFLPRVWRVQLNGGATHSATLSVSYYLEQ